jgi:hypothetical protein
VLIKNDKVKVGDIVTIRTTNGEEVVGKLAAQDDKTIVLSKPIGISAQMTQTGEVGLSFVPFVVTRDDSADFIISLRGLLVYPGKCREDIQKSYIQATTGLTLPGDSGLIT